MESNLKLKELNEQLSGESIEERLKNLVSLYPDRVIFTTSFGIEDQVITHIIFSNNLNIKVVTLDTGRLFPETYEVFSQTILKYNKKINIYFPEYKSVEKMVSEKGPFSFYESKENREECCRLRKVVPLNRALVGMECWISGIRASQSDNRNNMNYLEYDEEKNIFKFHPLFDWSLEDVENYIKENNIPYNSLHDKGFLSIGCEPCTRAVIKGQDFRAGRWWWENSEAKECGLHIK
ncbi:MAG TPA: phosphoadenylyl-sulfate reductase [Bacteroidales bacterium]|nr:phosphoadenylyl-sulfate reductase [Bacteroidales bacterium]